MNAETEPSIPAPFDLARGQPTRQSSGEGHWAIPGAATTGVLTGGFSFHTGLDAEPWWEVDLGFEAPVGRVVVWNRDDAGLYAEARARPLAVQVSADRETWRTIHVSHGVFGGRGSGEPLIVNSVLPIPARYVRLQILREEYLHLDQVEVHLSVPRLRWGEVSAVRRAGGRLLASAAMTHDAGFFSNCSTTLETLVHLQAWGIEVERVDCSRIYNAFRDHLDTRDVHQDLFETRLGIALPPGVAEAPLQRFYAGHNHYHYRELGIGELRPFIARYFTPGASVRDAQARMAAEIGYDPDRTIVICWRGTDKHTEIPPTDIDQYITVAERLLAREPDLRIVIQTDQRQVRDAVMAHFGDRCRYFADLPVTAGDKVIHQTDVNIEHGITRADFARGLAASIEMLSHARYVITHTGNVGLWLALWRGSTEGLFQFDHEMKLVSPAGRDSPADDEAPAAVVAGDADTSDRPALQAAPEAIGEAMTEEERVRSCVERIRAAPLELLGSAEWLENELLPSLGLSDVMPAIYPEQLRPRCGVGIRSFQMPNQFAPYLAHLTTQGIETYAEIGVWQGGTFIITLEVLNRFTPIRHALAMDAVTQPQMRAYAALNPNVELFEGDSHGEAALGVLQSRPWDLVLIDGDHSEAGCRADFAAVSGHARRIAFHDTDNAVVPDVGKVWREVASQVPATVTEFHAQYDAAAAEGGIRLMGIGLLEYQVNEAALPQIHETGSTESVGLAAAVKRCFDAISRTPEADGMPYLDLVGMSGRRYRRFINSLVGELPEPRYLEVGVWAGSTFCSAIAGHKLKAVAVDNWSQFGGPKDAFLTNMQRFRHAEADIRFVESDFRVVDYASLGRFNTYLFDGPHEAADQYDALRLALPALDPEFVFIVDDWNWPEVREGTLQAIRDTGCEIVYSVTVRTTNDDTHPPHAGEDARNTDWHNGYFIGVLRQKATVSEVLAPTAPVPQPATAPAPVLAAPWAITDGLVGPAAADASLLVCISFHYLPSRLIYLLEVVRALSDFPVRRMDVVILTNTSDQAERALIGELVGPYLYGRKSLRLQTVTGLPHPFELTWAHKPLIRERFLVPDSPYTHFVYLEDDIRFGFANFEYFLRYRLLLASHGFVPSFLRVELQDSTHTLNSSDIGHQWGIADHPHVDIGEYAFIVPHNPYCAMFVHDQELAREYVASPSCDLAASERFMEGWGVRERSAAGLCWEKPPAGARFRHVIPVRRRPLSIPAECWIGHLPANYANDPDTYIGKIPATRMVLH